MIVLPPGLWVVCPRMPGAALSALGESAGTGSCVFSFPAASPQMGVLPPGLARRKGTAAVKIERQFFPCCRTARLQKREEPGVRFQAKVDALWRRESGRGRESRFPSPPASLQKIGALALRPARRKGAASGRTCERKWMRLVPTGKAPSLCQCRLQANRACGLRFFVAAPFPPTAGAGQVCRARENRRFLILPALSPFSPPKKILLF